ncbi:MAG: hypothetical protein AAGC93_03715 [Cyanobacteria bacterium P01_F01_bin.53]
MSVTVQAQSSIDAVVDKSAGSATSSSATGVAKTATDKRLATSADLSRMPAEDGKVCWIEVKRYPYQPDHQVELLHLQAEADALIIRLQAIGQQQHSDKLGEEPVADVVAAS